MSKFDNEFDKERNAETFADIHEDDLICENCNKLMQLESIDSDSDGNRKEYAYVCRTCD